MTHAPVHVVVLATPDQDQEAPVRVRAQRRASREALALAARIAGCPDQAFEKSDPRGAPVPTASGWHWTLSHDRWFVAGAVHPTSPLGVDLEKIALRRRALVERVADENERALMGEGQEPLDAHGFARLWTTKEAVLKAESIGIPGLAHAKVCGTGGPHLTHTTYEGTPRIVQHTALAQHLVSLCVRDAEAPIPIVWHLPPSPRADERAR